MPRTLIALAHKSKKVSLPPPPPPPPRPLPHPENKNVLLEQELKGSPSLRTHSFLEQERVVLTLPPFARPRRLVTGNHFEMIGVENSLARSESLNVPTSSLLEMLRGARSSGGKQLPTLGSFFLSSKQGKRGQPLL